MPAGKVSPVPGQIILCARRLKSVLKKKKQASACMFQGQWVCQRGIREELGFLKGKCPNTSNTPAPHSTVSPARRVLELSMFRAFSPNKHSSSSHFSALANNCKLGGWKCVWAQQMVLPAATLSITGIQMCLSQELLLVGRFGAWNNDQVCYGFNKTKAPAWDTHVPTVLSLESDSSWCHLPKCQY